MPRMSYSRKICGFGFIGRSVAGTDEERGGGVRAGDVRAGAPCALCRRGEDRLLLAAEETALAGVRIQRGEREPRLRDPMIPPQVLVRDDERARHVAHRER